MNLLSKLRTSFNLGKVDGFHGHVQEVLIHDGTVYPLAGATNILNHNGAVPASIDNFEDAHEASSVVSTAVSKRGALVSQIWPQWRRPDGSTFGDASLDPAQRPAVGTRANFYRMIERHDSYYGAAYIYRAPDGLRLLNPARVEVILASESAPDDALEIGWLHDCEIAGYLYNDEKGQLVRGFAPDEVQPFFSDPDPIAWWRGRSWVTSVLRDIQNDGQATQYISNFFRNDGTPSLVVRFDPMTAPDKADKFRERFLSDHTGSSNAHKTLFLGGGADITVVGSDLGQLALRDVVGGHENRIVSRSEVPAVIMGTREGMQGSALNAGNYAMTRRQWADSWFSPYAQALMGAIEPLLDKPNGQNSLELTFDPERVMFLQEDVLDASTTRSQDAATITQLVRDGFTPESAAAYVSTGRPEVLEHTGFLSVQLQEPGADPKTVGGDATQATDPEESSDDDVPSGR